MGKGDIVQISVEVNASVWTPQGATKMEKHAPELYERLGRPVADERVSAEQEVELARFLNLPRPDAMEKLLGSFDISRRNVKLELEWTTAGVAKAEVNVPDLYERLGKPRRNDRVSTVQLTALANFLKKSTQDVTKMMLDSGGVCEQ